MSDDNEKGCIWVVIIVFIMCAGMAFGGWGVPVVWRVVGWVGMVIMVVAFIGVAINNSGGSTRTDDTYTDERGRQRCHACQKVVYGDYEAADGAAQNALSHGTYLRPYYEPRCGSYHLSSQRPQ